MAENTTDFSAMDDAALTARIAADREQASALFATENPTIEQVDQVEALMASIAGAEAEVETRAAAVRDAEARFAAARTQFSATAVDEEVVDEAEAEDGDEEDEAEAEDSTEGEAEAEAEETVEASADTDNDEGGAAAEEETVTASGGPTPIKAQRISGASAARAAAKRTKRPARAETPMATITAAADVDGFATGGTMGGMEDVTKGLLSRVKGFPAFNAAAAQFQSEQSGGEAVLRKFGVASFGVNFDPSLVASGGESDYSAVRAAMKGDNYSPDAITAGGWCSPSETIYSFIADYVVDGLISVPEVSAPRGGLNITTGPQRGSQGTALDDFGFVQTEAQAIARQEKTCEVIECPDFEEVRLDAIGYCFKVPILTQTTYPELVTDALRFADVLYAHKVNARVINALVGMSTNVTTPLSQGASFTDTLEALSLVALVERRKWNVGENAKMEVKLPQFVREVFRADMSRRTGLALTDTATDQKIAAEFAVRNLVVEYVSDWQEITTGYVWPETFKAMIYPVGTFVKAVEPVINLSAVYDAASLAINEYTGVFFEQGMLTAQVGYGSSLVSIPVCTSGMTGAAAIFCEANSI